MDELVRRIVMKVADPHSHLTMVKNPDGFLSRPDIQDAVRREGGVLLLPITSTLELRVRFELSDRNLEEKVCYIINEDLDIIPDMKPFIKEKGTVTLSDLMPVFDQRELQKSIITWSIAAFMCKKRYTYKLSPSQTASEVKNVIELYGDSVDKIISDLESIKLDWNSPQTIEEVSKVVLRAVSHDKYPAIEPAISHINDNFQEWLGNHYATLSSASHVAKPKLVNKVLPHIAYKHERQEKIALVVIDGMSYWQYLVLHKQLVEKGLHPQNDMTMAWISTITKLSRQAIFRGDIPHLEYQQNPSSEKRLWDDFWTSPSRRDKRMNDYELAYQHGSLSITDSGAQRLAVVDVDLDEKMHSSTDNKDLFSLTVNWAEKASEDILYIHKQGYAIYITTDHGNIHAHAWRGLASQEKTFLYKDGSRGTRHLIYENTLQMEDFIQANPEVSSLWMTGDKWLVWKNNQCFKLSDCITHGGSHLFEVVIPFIKI